MPYTATTTRTGDNRLHRQSCKRIGRGLPVTDNLAAEMLAAGHTTAATCCKPNLESLMTRTDAVAAYATAPASDLPALEAEIAATPDDRVGTTDEVVKPVKSRKPKVEQPAAPKAKRQEPKAPATARVAIPLIPADHTGDTYVCVTCGEAKKVSTFPTTQPGVRKAQCRACRDSKRTPKA